MYKVKDNVIYNGHKCFIGQVLGDGRYTVIGNKRDFVIEVYEKDLEPVDSNRYEVRHVIKYIVVDTLNADRPITVYDKEKDAIEKCETLNKVSINIGDIFKHSDGTAVEVVNSTLEETEVMLEIAGSVYYSKYNTQQFLKEFTK